MIPIVQFDPASLAIFAEGPTMALDPELLPLVNATISGNSDPVASGFRALAGRSDIGRALQLTSAFLHEKRHFHDFIATNYGAYRFRQFQEVYANLPTILQSGRGSNGLCLPLEVNLDPVRRRVLGIEPPPPEILALARAFGDRRRKIEKDRQPYPSRLGTFEIGGEAQLEALAYAAQSRFVSHFGGSDAHDAFSTYVFDREQFAAKYGAFINLGVAAGMVPVRLLEALEGRDDQIIHRAHIDAALLECAIFAALQADYVPHRRNVPEGAIESSYPAERFAAIATHLVQEYKSLCAKTDGLHWGECWEAVDATCLKLFGFRVHEQMARDIESNEMLLEGFRRTQDEVVIGTGEDFIELRKAMCDRLEKAPVQVASTEYFALSAGADVDPIVVLANSRGELGDVPEGYTRLMGYDTSEEDGKTRPWRKWWWAAAVGESSRAAAPDALRFRRPNLFYSVIDSYAPTAKLVLNGRKVRTLIGPELLFAEERGAAKVGVALRFFPGFEFPDDEIPEDVLRFFRARGELICDYTHKPIPRGEATVLTPWAMRRYPDLAKYTIEHLGGTDIAYHFFVRDWSHWAASREAMVKIRPLMQRQLPLAITP